MVRFKVIKGSHLLLAVAVLALLAALVYIGIDSGQRSAAADPMRHVEAKAISAFASGSVMPLEIKIVAHSPSPAPQNEPVRRILIYHTHTHEAYTQDAADPYVAVETWRTEDAEHSVVRLGEILSAELRLRGYDVTHDATDHELDSLNDSYVRSLKTLESYEEEFDLCIDLHRDAYSEGLGLCHKAPDGTEYAQLMLLVGRGDNYPSAEKPDYKENLHFAQTLTQALNEQISGICRNVTVKQGRYNQHIGKHSILVEVGHNRNYLSQAMASIPILAEGIHRTMLQFH